MRASRSLVLSLAVLASSLGVSAGCSSSSNTPADAAAGHDGAAGGHDGGGTTGADAAAGGAGQSTDAADAATDADAATNTDAATDADAASIDGGRDALLADISSDVVPTDGAMSIVLSSTALAEGEPFAAVNTCAGVNTSPPLSWTAGPAGTMSYAVVLTDLSIDAVHWVIWDIPAGTTSLAAALPGDTALTAPAGAKQVHKVEFFGAGGAYRGPCPSGANHVYQFEVDAIGAATLAGVPATPTTESVKAAVQAASLAHGDLEGTSNAKAPPADAAGQ
jgi:Raf kinase inhibitor-like YbhB/YbcL family protein